MPAASLLLLLLARLLRSIPSLLALRPASCYALLLPPRPSPRSPCPAPIRATPAAVRAPPLAFLAPRPTTPDPPSAAPSVWAGQCACSRCAPLRPSPRQITSRRTPRAIPACSAGIQSSPLASKPRQKTPRAASRVFWKKLLPRARPPIPPASAAAGRCPPRTALSPPRRS